MRVPLRKHAAAAGFGPFATVKAAAPAAAVFTAAWVKFLRVRKAPEEIPPPSVTGVVSVIAFPIPDATQSRCANAPLPQSSIRHGSKQFLN
jgi:hypothetical protein